MYKNELTLNGLKCLYAIKPNQTKPNHTGLIYVYKNDLALNDLKGLICHQTKPNPLYYIYMHINDLVLNDLNRVIGLKTKPNQTKPDDNHNTTSPSFHICK